MSKHKIQDLVNSYRSGFTLPQPFYTDDEVFDAECESIFKTQWIYAGSLANIPVAGDYFLYHLQKEAIIVIRGNGDEVFAHYNTCTHRGSAICLADSGRVMKLVCPYHQWVFNKNGSLQHARMMPDDFCKEDYALRSVHVRCVGGLIFICLAEVAPDFTLIEKSFATYLEPSQIHRSKVAHTETYRIKANWKLVGENFRECYHCQGAHNEYCAAVIGANLMEETEELSEQKLAIWAAKGLETNLIEIDPKATTSYAIRYPLRLGFESYSLDGKRVSIPMGTHQDYDAGVVGLVNYPNFWMDAVSDYIWIMRVTPIGVGETEIQFTWLVDGDAQEDKDYDLEHLTAFWKITGHQDNALCENNYKGIQSQGYRSGPYAPSEDQVVNFIDWCVGRLKG